MTYKFVVAPDSFKESLSAKGVCIAMENGIHNVFPDAIVNHVPMADGGEGTVEALVDATEGKIIEVDVQGPLKGQVIKAKYGILGDGRTAVIEMAEASGLGLVPREDRNPLITTTYGTGELIKAALDQGVEGIVIGIGGSATNDGGAGMAQALGAKLLDKDGEQIDFGGGSLGKIEKIDISELDERLHKTKIRVACDVDNYLTGITGASAVFGPQKGATPEMVQILDDNLKHYANIIKRDLGKEVDEFEGAGAAGGLGAGLMAFTNATLQKGVEIVIDTIGLEWKIRDCDFVITGEGGMDFQTKFGKTPYGVAKVAEKYNKPVFAIAGTLGENFEELYEHGFSAIFSVMQKPCSLEQALKDGATNIEKTVESIVRMIKVTKGVQ
ncbi:MAG TPA: glycerate kinase [Erysipelotrichaceae bacterium]|nr:glycerate kinase [Erysipelotrichaceae bacterium]